MQLTTIFTAAAVLLVAAPVAGQEGTDTTTYTGAAVPVWVMVEDVEGDAGAHRVSVAVKWDDYRSTLPFSREIGPGDLTVFLPRTEDADDVDPDDACRFTSTRMDHGDPDTHPAIRADADCLALPAEFLPLIGVEYIGSLAPMACKEAAREDGTEDPALRYFACYWSAPQSVLTGWSIRGSVLVMANTGRLAISYRPPVKGGS